MQFFENPRLVTALVFFIQTILALFNMDTFLYWHIYVIFFIPFFFGFPFAFYYVYKFILMDLDKEKAEMPEPHKDEVKPKETKEHDKQPAPSPAKKQEEVQAVMTRIQDKNLEKPRSQTLEKTEKHIQVIHATDEFIDEEPESIEAQEQPILTPIVVNKASVSRQELKAQASEEATNLNEDKMVLPAPLPVGVKPESEKEA